MIDLDMLLLEVNHLWWIEISGEACVAECPWCIPTDEHLELLQWTADELLEEPMVGPYDIFMWEMEMTPLTPEEAIEDDIMEARSDFDVTSSSPIYKRFRLQRATGWTSIDRRKLDSHGNRGRR